MTLNQSVRNINGSRFAYRTTFHESEKEFAKSWALTVLKDNGSNFRIIKRISCLETFLDIYEEI